MTVLDSDRPRELHASDVAALRKAIDEGRGISVRFAASAFTVSDFRLLAKLGRKLRWVTIWYGGVASGSVISTGYAQIGLGAANLVIGPATAPIVLRDIDPDANQLMGNLVNGASGSYLYLLGA